MCFLVETINWCNSCVVCPSHQEQTASLKQVGLMLFWAMRRFRLWMVRSGVDTVFVDCQIAPRLTTTETDGCKFIRFRILLAALNTPNLFGIVEQILEILKVEEKNANWNFAVGNNLTRFNQYMDFFLCIWLILIHFGPGSWWSKGEVTTTWVFGADCQWSR